MRLGRKVRPAQSALLEPRVHLDPKVRKVHPGPQVLLARKAFRELLVPPARLARKAQVVRRVPLVRKAFRG